MTPLFPASDNSVSIRQGKGGDCYLLASLDCILNGDSTGREKISSMFTQTSTGVELRIKPNAQSAKLQKDKLAGKYGYRKDPITGDDIFTISNERLKEIDDAHQGVQSNSLAVKILERISSYYYVGDWDHSPILASIVAHDIHNRHDKTSTEFVGDLLGFNAHNYPGSSFEKILKLQDLDSNQPVYISMGYGDKDVFGQIHGRHALRLKSLEKTGPDQYRLQLVNPWDNRAEKVETFVFSSRELIARNARFCIYSTDAYAHELKMMLAQCPKEQGKYALDNPTLFNSLLQKKKNGGGLRQDELVNLIEDHKRLNSPRDVVPPRPIIVEQKAEDLELHKRRLIINPHDEGLALLLLEQFKQQGTKVDVPFMQKYVVDTAIYNNSKRIGNSGIAGERSKIHAALTAYYFLGVAAENTLTRTMQLRFYFSNNIFSGSDINKLFTPQRFNFLTLANCLTDVSFDVLLQSSNSNSLKEYLKTINLADIDKAFVKELMAHAKIENISDLNRQLGSVATINPNLVKKIIEIQLVTEKPSVPKERIMSLQTESGRVRIEQQARELLSPISNLSVLFTEINGIQSISAKKEELIRQLSGLAKEPGIIGADDTLRLLGKESLVKQKLAEINKQAEFYEKNVLLKEEKMKMLQAINFTSRLHSIEEMKNRLTNEAKTNPKYETAALRADGLFKGLSRLHKNFLNDPTISVATFKEEAGDKIKYALPVLQEHRGWKKILESIANALLTLVETLGLKSKNSTWGIFEVKTESSKTTEEFVESLNKLGNS